MLDADNPLARASDLPHALPPFDRIREEHLRPALLAGMAEQRAVVEAIATDPSEPGLQVVDGFWMGLSKRSLQVA